MALRAKLLTVAQHGFAGNADRGIPSNSHHIGRWWLKQLCFLQIRIWRSMNCDAVYARSNLNHVPYTNCVHTVYTAQLGSIVGATRTIM